MLQHWWIWLTGFGGLTGIVLLAIFGGPVVPLLASLAEKLLGPIAGVIGNGLSLLVKAEIGGGIDIIQSGQRILFVVTVCAVTWQTAVHTTWSKVHAGWWLTAKHYQVVKPPARRR